MFYSVCCSENRKKVRMPQRPCLSVPHRPPSPQTTIQEPDVKTGTTELPEISHGSTGAPSKPQSPSDDWTQRRNRAHTRLKRSAPLNASTQTEWSDEKQACDDNACSCPHIWAPHGLENTMMKHCWLVFRETKKKNVFRKIHLETTDEQVTNMGQREAGVKTGRKKAHAWRQNTEGWNRYRYLIMSTYIYLEHTLRHVHTIPSLNKYETATGTDISITEIDSSSTRDSSSAFISIRGTRWTVASSQEAKRTIVWKNVSVATEMLYAPIKTFFGVFGFFWPQTI